MKSSNVPGYKELFPGGNDRYVDLVRGISSEMIIRVCSALNNELNGIGGMAGNQQNILADLSLTFTTGQKADLLVRLGIYQQKVGEDTQVILFGTRYLLSMVINELNQSRTVADDETKDPVEYQLFKAYLLVVDEIAAKDHDAIDFKALKPGEPQNPLRILWLPIIQQFEFNEHSHMLFETYKTLCFLKYLQNSSYREYLKEYLNCLHFINVSGYLASFNQINRTIESIDPSAKMLKRLNYIVPEESADQTHLQRLSVNVHHQKTFTLADLKKAPLCFAPDRRGYMVIDYNYCHKKMFRGAFFETCHTTSLTQQEGLTSKEKQAIFNTYSTDASNAFEKQYFKPVMQLLTSTGCDVRYFDDGTSNCPDCYVRVGHNVILFEFKAYVFRDELAAKPDFDKLMAYIEERFVVSDSEKQKGVGQLVNQIGLLNQGKFGFDPVGKELLTWGRLHFYPVIVYTDFNFSIPGINTHLNQRMWELLAEKTELTTIVQPLVMLNLETIMDIAIAGGNVSDLGRLFLAYFQFLMDAGTLAGSTPTIGNFTRAHSSFDEFYRAYVEKPNSSDKNTRDHLHKLLELSGINFDEFKEEL